MDLVQRLSKGKQDAKARRERNKYKRLYFRFCPTYSSDESDPYSDYSQYEEEEEFFESITDDDDEEVNENNSDEETGKEFDFCAKIDLHDKKQKKRILSDIFKNAGKGNGSRYSEETKLYSYNLFCKSPTAYSYLRSVFPFPSESLLHENFNSAVLEHKKDITDIKKIGKRFEYQKKIYNLKNEKIKSCLAIDAFAATVLHKIKSNDDESDNDKHVFLFLVCPLDLRFKPFIIHLKKNLNGNGNFEIDALINEIKEMSKETNFPINYCAVDGDSHYSHFFREQFNTIIQLINENSDLDMLNEKISKLPYIFISDPLHIWKNQRSRVLNNKIVVNPYKKSRYVTGLNINKVLNLGPILNDFSNLSKMRDKFAIGLFNFKNAKELLEKYSIESFFFIFLNSLWVESILNEFISPKTRVYLLTILLNLLVSLYNDYKSKSLPQNVSFKRSAKNDYISIFTLEKLERIIPTVLITRYEICQGNLLLGLDRLGTHDAENKIGNIRSLVNQDETIGKLIHVAAKNDFIKSLLKSNDEKRKTRLNQGGVSLNYGKEDIDFGGSAEEISNFLLYQIGLIEEAQNDMNITVFTQNLDNFIQKCPYSPKISYTSTTSAKITIRYYSLSKEEQFTPSTYVRHNWTKEEIGIIDHLLIQGTENQASIILPYIQPSTLESFIRKRKTELAMRPMLPCEVNQFNFLMSRKLNLKDIASLLPCRTPQSLKKLFRL